MPGLAPVAIVDVLPIYRLGLFAACERARIEAVEAASLRDLPPKAEFCAVVVVLRSQVDWQRMAGSYVQKTGTALVAVLPSLAAPIVRRAFSAGATSVIDMTTSPEGAVQVIRAALEGKTLLPTGVAREILRDTADSRLLSVDQLEWLQCLAHGLTITELAKRVGYSEREMHRHLSKLYMRLGARGLKQALLFAERAGLLG